MIAAAVVGLALLIGWNIPPAVAKQEPGLSRSDRTEAYRNGKLPLPGTPDLTQLDARLRAKGLERGAPVYVRIFKQSSELELWLGNDGRFELFATYPICNWDGELGPKLLEGDRQSPEGLYSVSVGQLRWFGRWHRGFDLSYPNAYDSAQQRTGSAILIHGGCSTVGCFAMTNAVIDELFDLATAAMAKGQTRFAVHVFPFPMTPDLLEALRDSPWHGFWSELKPAYDAFEQTRIPPRAGACGEHYIVVPGEPGYDGRMPVGVVCPSQPNAIMNRESSIAVADWPVPSAGERAAQSKSTTERMALLLAADKAGTIAELFGAPAHSGNFGPSSRKARKALTEFASARQEGETVSLRCNPNLASCRHWIASQAGKPKRSKGKKAKQASTSP